MTNSWGSSRRSAITATQILLELMEDASSDRSRLIQGYLDAKRQLAAAFQALAMDGLPDDSAFGELVDRLEMTMTATFPHIPSRYRLIRGFGAAHRRLFVYLADRQGQEVSIDELRLLTGDAVHTERRLRELRDLGAGITMTESGGHRGCRMVVPEDLTKVGHDWIIRQVLGDASLQVIDRDQLLHSLS